MRALFLIIIICTICISCGKKDRPEYQVLKQKNLTLYLK